VLVAHSSKEMFDLVDGVELYPQFLPWCAGAKVLETRPDGKTARIDIDYHGVRVHFTTDNVNRANESIAIALRDGPFRQLQGEWRFAALAPDSCKVSLALAYEFMTPLDLLVGAVFGRIANTLIDSFVRRADALY
jgi:ribosome-associated toxin RatA of RatAB toxin-antitoxin module